MTGKEARVTTKGQVTIPKAIRDAFDLEPGTTVVFRKQNGRVMLEPRVNNPRESLKELRDEIQLGSAAIEAMQDNAEEAWDR